MKKVSDRHKQTLQEHIKVTNNNNKNWQRAHHLPPPSPQEKIEKVINLPPPTHAHTHLTKTKQKNKNKKKTKTKKISFWII